MTLLINFYQNTLSDSEGRMLSDIHNFTNEELEECHDHIQWLFPLSEPSRFNPNAPLMTKFDWYWFGADPVIRGNLEKSFRVVFKFMRETSSGWSGFDHNHLRISRMIQCLVGCGRQDLAQELFDWAKNLPANSKSKNIWKTLLGNANENLSTT